MAKEDLRKSIQKAEAADPRKSLFQEQGGLRRPDPEPVPEPEVPAAKPRKNKRNPEYIRKTYFLSPELIEAIRIYAFEERKDISEAVRFLLLESIPDRYLEEARKNLK